MNVTIIIVMLEWQVNFMEKKFWKNLWYEL